MTRGATLAHAVAECALVLPTGETVTLFATLRSDRAPYWRVVSLDDLENLLIAKAVEAIGEEALCERIATAAALWNLWDAVRSNDPE